MTDRDKTGPDGRAPFVLKPGEGPSVWSLGGRFTLKLTEKDTAGRFALVDALAFRTTEPPLHVHHREDEAWYILDGQMTFFVGEAALEARTGSFVFAPRGIPHTFTVDVEPTRVLVFASPAGFEHFALELGRVATSDEPPADLSIPGPDILAPVAARYGIEVIGPPRRAMS
jgi:mannose-6-phosphate isomerase-like protein (cupin superfamily)